MHPGHHTSAVAITTDAPHHGTIPTPLHGKRHTACCGHHHQHAGRDHPDGQSTGRNGNAHPGGVGASGNGTSIGGPSNIDEFTQWQWMTVKGEAPAYPI